MEARPKTKKSAEKSPKENMSPKVKEPERPKLRTENSKDLQHQKGDETEVTPSNSTDSVDKQIIPSTKLSTMSIEPTEGNQTTADNTVDKKTDEMSKAEVNKKFIPTEVKGKGVAQKKTQEKDEKDSEKVRK